MFYSVQPDSPVAIYAGPHTDPRKHDSGTFGLSIVQSCSSHCHVSWFQYFNDLVNCLAKISSHIIGVTVKVSKEASASD